MFLVDNGSEDGTIGASREFPSVRVHRLPENQGYVRGNNAGIALSDPDTDVVLLNNDTSIEDPDWLSKLSRAAHRHPSIGIVAPRLVLPGGRLIHAGTYIVPETCWGQTIGRDESDIGQYPGSREVQGVVFAVVYIRREVLRSLGPLPEAYVSFFEDTDYSLQARDAGFRVECIGDLTVLHETGATLSDEPERRQELFERSRAVFVDRWKARLEAAYELDLVAFSTAGDRREFGPALIDLLVELDALGVRVSHRDADGVEGFASAESPWGRGHFARVFAERPIVPGSVGVVFGAPGEACALPDGTDPATVPGFGEASSASASPGQPGGAEGIVQGLRGVLAAPVPIATTHFHPGVRRASRNDGKLLLVARVRADDVEQAQLLLSAFQRLSGSDLRLLVVADPEVPIPELLDLLSTAPVVSGRAGVVRDPFREHEAACLYGSADGSLSWRTDRHGSRERWLSLACGRPVLFVGDEMPVDDTRRFLRMPFGEPGSSSLDRIEESLQWFSTRSTAERALDIPELRSAVAARSISSVAASIRDAARAISRRRHLA